MDRRSTTDHHHKEDVMTASTASARENALAADQAKLASAPKRATRNAATKGTAPKVTTKRTTTKRAATKGTARKTAPKVTGPTDRDAKRATAAFAIKTAVAAFKALPVTKGQVTIDGVSYPRDVAWAALRQTFGYVPPAAWDTKLLGVRDVGRPVSSRKAA
jgi:hypothetical protein